MEDWWLKPPIRLAAVWSAVEPGKEDEPAKKKAALASSPAAVPAASSAAAFFEPVPKIAPPKAGPKEPQQAPPAGTPSSKTGSSWKSLVSKQKSRHKGDDQPPKEQKPVSAKIETNNVNDVLQRLSKDSFNVMFVD